jgi:hypothetical protein
MTLKDYTKRLKIPKHIKNLTRKQMAYKDFTAKHSSLMRMITKRAEHITEIFDDSSRQVMMKLYPFKRTK